MTTSMRSTTEETNRDRPGLTRACDDVYEDECDDEDEDGGWRMEDGVAVGRSDGMVEQMCVAHEAAMEHLQCYAYM